MNIIEQIKAVLEMLEFKLQEASAHVSTRLPSSQTDAIVLARIESMTRASVFQWLLEMLPGIHRGQVVPVDQIKSHLEEPRKLFRNRLAEINEALAKNDLSLAQFPRLGQEARVELATTSAVLSWILVLIEPLLEAVADAGEHTGRYIAGNWSHPLSGLSDRECRLVIDCETNEVVAMQLRDSVDRWLPASSADIADVQDSIQNANGEALDNPEEFGLAWVNELPDWATTNAAGDVVPS